MILVSNDDGIHSEGLRALRAEEVRPGWYAVDGTPTDCVLLAVHRMLEERQRLVVSGIHRGANLGDDVHYCGTVSAAKECGEKLSSMELQWP